MYIIAIEQRGEPGTLRFSVLGLIFVLHAWFCILLLLQPHSRGQIVSHTNYFIQQATISWTVVWEQRIGSLDLSVVGIFADFLQLRPGLLLHKYL